MLAVGDKLSLMAAEEVRGSWAQFSVQLLRAQLVLGLWSTHRGFVNVGGNDRSRRRLRKKTYTKRQ